ncbi:MAG TPA: hypothetical protein VEV87_01860 [Chitinophagaceae bacterium]|nr:hypothetical protein [Chitinophagaceae bacterium]
MRRVLYMVYVFSIATMILSGSCKKSGGGGGTNEPALSVELNPPAGSNQLPSPGPDFPLIVTIKSTMPAAGVKIDVTAREDVGGSTPFFNQSVNSTTSVNNFNITGSPRNVTIRVTVTVTSLSTSSNTFTGSYTYSRK